MTLPPWDHSQSSWWQEYPPRPQPSLQGGDVVADIRERLARIETIGQSTHHDVRYLSRGFHELYIRVRGIEQRQSQQEARVRQKKAARPPEPPRRPLPVKDILQYAVAFLVLLLVLLGKITGADALGAVLKIFGAG